MKVIQSFWTKPFTNPASTSFESRFQGGFNEDKQFIYTWALSLLSIKEYFPSVHLVTDTPGEKAWIEFFEFPYDSYSTGLDEIEDMPSDFWGAGKLQTYASTNDPFVHFDVDVILGKEFKSSILENNLIAEFQYDDSLLKRYELIVQKLVSSKVVMSTEILETIRQPYFSYSDYNLGITGGRDLEFMNNYAKKALADLRKNIAYASKNDKIQCSFLNCFFEQFYFYIEATNQSKKVDKLIEKTILVDVDYQKQKIASGIKHLDFVHLHGGYKRLYPNLSEKWLSELYPDFYRHLQKKLAYIESRSL
jgi:hypothetical protein